LKGTSKKQTPIDDYVPYKLKKEDGIRLFVSYHNKQESYHTFERKVINPDIINFLNGEVINVLEYDIIEIEKYLKRNGATIEYPTNINFIKPFDFYTNYPIILHRSHETQNSISITLEAFK